MCNRPNLTFDKGIVQQLVDHAIANKEKGKKAQLILVGDQGIYLMSAGKPGLPKDEKSAKAQAAGEQFYRSLVAYAKGCDPDKDEDFYENKRDLYGGDDGADYLDVDGFMPVEDFLGLRVTPTEISIIKKVAK